jgi:hypothetical protein
LKAVADADYELSFSEDGEEGHGPEIFAGEMQGHGLARVPGMEEGRFNPEDELY